MTNKHLNKFMSLKVRIENATDRTERNSLIIEYNKYLEYVMSFGLKRPLPNNTEIEDEYLLGAYLDYKKHYFEEGPFTIFKLLRSRDTVALVVVKSIRSWGRIVVVDPIEVFKGRMEINERLISSRGWKPDKWFTKRERCVVFANNNYVGGTLGRMPIVCENGDEYLECWDCDDQFWNGLETTCIRPGIIRVNWQMARSLFLELSER